VKLVSLNWLHETRCLELVFPCARRVSLCFSALTDITPAVLHLLLVYSPCFLRNSLSLYDFRRI